MRSWILLTLGLAGAAFLPLADSPRAVSQDKQAENPAAIARARKTVRMLDDVYKTGIVLMTDKYVRTEKDYPAGRLAVNWFKAVSKNGTHGSASLTSAANHSKANVAKDDFDKEGVRQMKLGKDFYEQVIRKDGKAYLRAMTPVPVVNDKCIMCHAHYKTAKKGEAIGALTYAVPLD
jgi:hypothetical protein